MSSIKDVIIIQADRGEATVIWDIDDYPKETNNQLHNKKFYHKLQSDLFNDHQNIIIYLFDGMVKIILFNKKNIKDAETSSTSNPPASICSLK